MAGLEFISPPTPKNTIPTKILDPWIAFPIKIERRESEVRPILCGSGTPHRNMKPLRSDKGPMSGNETTSSKFKIKKSYF